MEDTASRFRVLLVDDTPEIRALLRVNFELEPDFEVVADAGDGVAAITNAREHQPDLVVLDLAMPVMDGLQALPEIVAAAPNTRVLVLSGFTSDQLADEALELGAHAYVEKGIRPELLMRQARQVLGAGSPPVPRDAVPVASAAMSADEIQRYIEDVAMAIHELRGPLTSIDGFSTTLLARWEQMDEEQKLAALRVIADQSQRLGKMISDLLMISRLEAGHVRLKVEDVRLRDALERVAAELGPGSIAIECDRSLYACAEPNYLHQIVSNYLRNALKYGAPPILVAARAADEFVEVRVHDHGSGVEPSFISQLFEKFSRGNGERQGSQPGSGLGLAIVKRLVEAQGGHAWYEPSDRGACFAFSLPRA